MCSRQQKPHVFLPLCDKLKIIEAVNAGKTISSIAKHYNISRTAVGDLKRRKRSLKDVSNLNEIALKRRKVIKRVHNEELERAVLMWYNEKREMGLPLSGPMICEKALFLNDRLNGSEKFKATTGWLDAFKRRYGIKISQEEVIFSSGDAAVEVCLEFQQFIKDENYDLSLVFNADESGMFWKSLPNGKEENPQGWRDSKERISILFCANADGSFALPLLIVGKSWSSRSSFNTAENMLELPVMYQNQSAASMTSEIFLDWYTNIFIPSVLEMQEKTGNHGKVLLLIDTAKCHPSEEILNSVNENFQVKFIPTKVTLLIQPMGQGIIEKTKRIYRRALVESLVSFDESITVDEFLESHTMEDCCFILASAFESVSVFHLRNAWNKLYGTSQFDEKIVDHDDETMEGLYKGFCQMLNNIKGFENVYPVSIKRWLNADLYDTGWEPLLDDEIIEFVTKKGDETVSNETLIDNLFNQSFEQSEDESKEFNKFVEQLKKENENCQIEEFEQSSVVPKNENCYSKEIFQSESPVTKIDNLQSKSPSQSRKIEGAIQFLHDWCKQRKEYTLSDCLLLRKWQTLASKESKKKN
ncbi:jerky protein homolog-like [Leptopilina heterotoma]|uniref:jerky protein homolog-like n=1 Tax=Leptopilina heterotoma TaxID=63436 RepID=UPI001CA87CA5|nr:jerky protein homolog-like [Leptopilina heterotoma]